MLASPLECPGTHSAFPQTKKADLQPTFDDAPDYPLDDRPADDEPTTRLPTTNLPTTHLLKRAGRPIARRLGHHLPCDARNILGQRSDASNTLPRCSRKPA